MTATIHNIGGFATVEELLRHAINHKQEIEGCAIVVRLNNGKCTVLLSMQKVSDLCCAAVALLDEANQEMKK